MAVAVWDALYTKVKSMVSDESYHAQRWEQGKGTRTNVKHAVHARMQSTAKGIVVRLVRKR